MTEAKPNTVLAVVLAVAAAAALVYSCVAQSWLYNPRNKQHFEVGFGLMSNYECELSEMDAATKGECHAMSNSELVASWEKQLEDIRKRAKEDPADPTLQAFVMKATDEFKVSGVWPALGYITLGCAALAALSLLACAGLVLAKKRIAWPMMPTTAAILGTGIGLITGCIFVALKPGPPGYVGVHLGFFAFGAGVIVGLVAALMMNKLLRPYDPDLLADTMNPEHY
jgi:hypothetical protein